MLNVHMWGYFCSVYVCGGISALRIYVAVTSPYPQDRGVTWWYQRLGSHIFCITSRQINVILICNWSAWVLAIHFNYKYDVVFSPLISIPWNPYISSVPSSLFPWFFLFYLFTFRFHLSVFFQFLVPPSHYLLTNSGMERQGKHNDSDTSRGDSSRMCKVT